MIRDRRRALSGALRAETANASSPQQRAADRSRTTSGNRVRRDGCQQDPVAIVARGDVCSRRAAVTPRYGSDRRVCRAASPAHVSTTAKSFEHRRDASNAASSRALQAAGGYPAIEAAFANGRSDEQAGHRHVARDTYDSCHMQRPGENRAARPAPASRPRPGRPRTWADSGTPARARRPTLQRR